MIINCPNCNKRFKINTSLIPVEGRDLKCGSCDHVWFYKIEDKNLEPLSLKDDIINNEDKLMSYRKESRMTAIKYFSTNMGVSQFVRILGDKGIL